MFGKKARLDRLETVKAPMKSSMRENELVYTYVQKLERAVVVVRSRIQVIVLLRIHYFNGVTKTQAVQPEI
ncbi:hypothetical protein OSB04_019953 [Centaurea solstitialis]|uniref:Uncharacterized protein n=1 Tax=Centaurea solstitialis TaxID=347529 RepID=A0AA38SRB3_9ASTR|nr:hypothetical protein OSB04_019953 [Centaurea solstitialis]